MATLASDLYFALGGTKELSVVSFNAVRANPKAHEVAEGTTLVICSCMVSGRALMELSQVLRSIQLNASIVFIIGLARANSLEELREIKSNITHTVVSARRFGYHRLEEIFPPDYSAIRRSIWTQEIDMLRRLQSKLLPPEEDVNRHIAERINIIQRAEGTSVVGLTNECFWPSINGTNLRLRPNFAFFKFKHDPSNVTHAEVYFTVACVLHNLRRSKNRERSLKQYEYDRALLHPHNFYRLNDPVIQAALLRAALPVELNYRVDADLSAEMAEVLRFIISEKETERGEAAPEFTLALAMGQLRLAQKDQKEVLELLLNALPSQALISYVAQLAKADEESALI
jgi:hypothetical protein